MNKGFWKGLSFSFSIGTLLNLLLYVVAYILQKSGFIKNKENNFLFIVLIYAAVFTIYFLATKRYFKHQSEENLEKLKKDVEKITGRKLI